METVTIAAAAEHGLSFTTLAGLAVSIVVVCLIAWQVISRARAERQP